MTTPKTTTLAAALAKAQGEFPPITRVETLMATGAWGWGDPVWRYACDGCGKDRRHGFGWW